MGLGSVILGMKNKENMIKQFNITILNPPPIKHMAGSFSTRTELSGFSRSQVIQNCWLKKELNLEPLVIVKSSSRNVYSHMCLHFAIHQVCKCVYSQ